MIRTGRWWRRPTYAEGSVMAGPRRWRCGFHVAYYLNTTNVAGSRFYTVQFWLLGWESMIHINWFRWPEDGFYEGFDKHTGKVSDLRVDDPEMAKKMEPYRTERQIQWRLMGRLPRKHRSLNVTHSWRFDT